MVEVSLSCVKCVQHGETNGRNEAFPIWLVVNTLVSLCVYSSFTPVRDQERTLLPDCSRGMLFWVFSRRPQCTCLSYGYGSGIDE